MNNGEPKIVRRETCRLCESDRLTDLFSLGEQYVSDFVPEDKIKSGVKCPIELVLCERCTLVQLRHTAPQDFLYTRHYWYRSGVTETMRNALADVVYSATDVVDLKSGDVVLDIGSNDGTLLRSYGRTDVVKVGVEPAINLAPLGVLGTDYLIDDFWGAPGVADNFLNYRGVAKIITACGMFYDLEDPNPFVADVAKVLHPDGVFVAQLQCLKQTMELGDVGNFCHEHLEYYSVRSLVCLFEKHGMEVVRIEENKVNGGSYRVYAVKSRDTILKCYDVQQAMRVEYVNGYHLPETYLSFSRKLAAGREKCREFVVGEVRRGKKVWVYGASTKGNVLLQYYGLDRNLIEGAADRSPEKHGKFTVGTGIPIHSEDYARKVNPDYFLVLPYAFLSEFVEREREWRKGGGKFIVPLPEFRVV